MPLSRGPLVASKSFIRFQNFQFTTLVTNDRGHHASACQPSLAET